MFDRFTDGARQVVVAAHDESRRLGHDHIDTDHLLLALLYDSSERAAVVLRGLGISLEPLRTRIEASIGQRTPSRRDMLPFTAPARDVWAWTLREAVQLRHGYIGAEHILLGLIREGNTRAAHALVALGADLNRVRQRIIQLGPTNLNRNPEAEAADTEAPGAREERPDAELWLLRNYYRELERLPQTIETLERYPQTLRPQEPGSHVNDQAGPSTTPRYRQIAEVAYRIAEEMGHGHVGVEHLFLAMLQDERCVPTQVMLNLDIDTDRVETELRSLMMSDRYNQHSPGDR